MLAAYGRRMRASPGPTRRTLVVSIEALLDARGGKNLRGQGQAHRSPSENARELAVYMYFRRCKLCRFVKPFVLRPLPKGPVAKAVIVYFMACKYSISGETRVHMCAPQSTRHASSLHRSVAGSHGHASLLSPLSGTRELRTRTRHGRARRSPHAARTITFQHTRHYTEFYIAPLPLAGRCIASFRGQQVTSPRLV